MFLFVWFILLYIFVLYIGCCLRGREMFCCCQSLFFLGRNEEVNGNDTRNLTTCGLCTDTEWGGSCGLSTDTEGHPAGWRPLFLWPPLIASFKGVSLLLNTRVSDKGMEGHEWCRRSLNIALYGGSFCVEDTPGGTCRIKRIVSNLKRDRGGYSKCKKTTPEEGPDRSFCHNCAIQLWESASPFFHNKILHHRYMHYRLIG